MEKTVLILGGTGRIGQSVALDIINHTTAKIIITGRKEKAIKLLPRMQFLALDLEEIDKLRQAIKNSDLVIHCAGPFHYRDGRVVKICIEEKVNYIDVSDHRSFYQKLIPYRELAIKAGITAVVNTGIFPGISNSIVREGVEQLDRVETIRLNYAVAGSGGAGLTVMRTTFLGLKKPFLAWIEGQWQEIKPYTAREVIDFPAPLGKTGVYWFDMPETYTFAESFQVQNVITKFGSIPDFYNHLTWITAHIFPDAWVESSRGIEFFSQVSYRMTEVTDKFSGIGVAMLAKVTGWQGQQKAVYQATMVHENTAQAAGWGTGSVAELILAAKLEKAGIYPVEQVLSTELFHATMKKRGIKLDRSCAIVA
ncbi:saccharopine dehydrogenase [Microcystis aeruginosa NIES-3806]|uniref:saccharopine dehydrogenase family protein n=1 Tax=Microcystis aeruginosa TaxID=1126 RepID=UPI001305BC81|nr:saccharopine dehydrogenase NADP-binding domain-containing protein [Microcystis aeruginosa]GCL53131.1 saccharopine dehydrogenase [Microcystis aeruginosa NIES-3806]